MMQHFDSDYMEGACPEILQRLLATNLEKTPGYGADAYCACAQEKIRAACACPHAEVYFLSGGTQTNLTVIDAALRPWQGVLAADTGHIHAHEAGAVEACGHKILPLPQTQGKLDAAQVERYCAAYWGDANKEHIIAPGMVYVSHPTEYGTLYSKAELQALHEVCKKYEMALFLDGARLGYGLAARNTDVTLPDVAALCDVFYIGGTKVGALFGEAVVVTNPALVPHFFTLIKRRGALLAKGRVLGLQFDTLFTDGLYEKLGKNAIDMAERLKEGLEKAGCPFFLKTQTNQQFILLTDAQTAALAGKLSCGFWEKPDETHTVLRLATSWATRAQDVDEAVAVLAEVCAQQA